MLAGIEAFAIPAREFQAPHTVGLVTRNPSIKVRKCEEFSVGDRMPTTDIYRHSHQNVGSALTSH